MRLRLPATSANLGSAFDAAAIAIARYLTINATASEQMSIHATGYDAALCSAIEGNLLLDTYADIMARNQRAIVPLALAIENEIPLGMGLGSSAAARLAAIVLANAFGRLRWTGEQILRYAASLEGHPDNASACWLGGFVTSCDTNSCVIVAQFAPPPPWRAVIVLPTSPLATSHARAALPTNVPRSDAVANLQRSALLAAAFAQGRGDWLVEAMKDALHQPYRMKLCPLLPLLLPLAGTMGVLGVALSGAGPAVLLIAESESAATSTELHAAIQGATAGHPIRILVSEFAAQGAQAWSSADAADTIR